MGQLMHVAARAQGDRSRHCQAEQQQCEPTPPAHLGLTFYIRHPSYHITCRDRFPTRIEAPGVPSGARRQIRDNEAQRHPDQYVAGPGGRRGSAGAGACRWADSRSRTRRLHEEIPEAQLPGPSERLKTLPNVVHTPHIGTAVRETRAEMAMRTVENIERSSMGSLPSMCSIPRCTERPQPATRESVSRSHHSQPGVSAVAVGSSSGRSGLGRFLSTLDRIRITVSAEVDDADPDHDRRTI